MQDVTKSELRESLSGFKLDSSSEGSFCFTEPLLLPQSPAETILIEPILRFELYGFLVRRLGPCMIPLLGQGLAELEVRKGIGRVHADRFQVSLLCFGVTSVVMQDGTEVHMDRGIRRVKPDGLPVGCLSF